jgi:3,4-dihydroxy 2-butanone 4-phosphate synthase / GTP cyclohydrolase II
MPICTPEEAIAEIRQGRMIILVDDEDRENEGDLTVAAEKVTPEIINFMATHGRGLICLALTGGHVDRLQLPMMVPRTSPSSARRSPCPSRPGPASPPACRHTTARRPS